MKTQKIRPSVRFIPYINFDIFERLIISIFIILTGIRTYAESPGIEIKGRIYAHNTSQPLEYATVSLMSLPDSVNIDNAITETNGSFRFKNVVNGSYYLVVQYMGYEKKMIERIAIADDSRWMPCKTLLLSRWMPSVMSCSGAAPT